MLQHSHTALQRSKSDSATAAAAVTDEAEAELAELVEAAGPARKLGKKARKAAAAAADPNAAEKAAGAKKEPPGWFDLKVNTSVYVTGLPDDVTVEELVEVWIESPLCMTSV